MANSSKKRKASEFDSDYNRTPAKSKTRRRSKGSKHTTKPNDEIPFQSESPYKPSPQANDDVFVQMEEIAPGFEFECGIRPGLQWKNMRSYRNVKLQDHTFSVGSVIYINKQSPPPKSPRPDATDAEILKYDRTNFWVGRIADTRAESEKAVFLRVYWLYWPEELPMGRQPYHGDRELVLSNAMDIIDAQTISGAADLTYWDENEPNVQYPDRFWRQTFDISQLGKDQKGGLSELRRHCNCQQPHNPDRTMFECKKSSCRTWNHKECLVEEILQQRWSKYETDGTLDDIDDSTIRVEDTVKAEKDDGESSLRDRILSPVRHLGKMMQDKIAPSVKPLTGQATPRRVEGTRNGTATTPSKGKTPKKPPKPNVRAASPWDGKLRVKITNTDEKDDDSPLVAVVEEIVGKKSKIEAKSWRIQLHCLVCGHTM